MNFGICSVALTVFYKCNRRKNDEVTDKLFEE